MIGCFYWTPIPSIYIEHIHLPSTVPFRTTSLSANYWIPIMVTGYSTRCRILFGTCLLVGMTLSIAILLVPILVIQSKYTITSTLATTTTEIISTSTTSLSTSSSSTTTLSTSTTSFSTTATTITSSTTTTTITTTSLSTTTTKAQLTLTSINGLIYGIFNTSIGGNSVASTSGFNIGSYPPVESPNNACDDNTTTKYLNFGSCSEIQFLDTCGLNTGFYLELLQGHVLVTGFRICTADDYPERDPLIISLEGSNQSGIALTLGSSWSLIYSGNSGLLSNPGRGICGLVQWFNNSIQYRSYRFLVSSKRGTSNSVQYADVQLFTS
ncbi:hypothetical protein I4U23_003496 [Adineta vaga]|nr:hypothetical protein I4U23_003496 [Adineta vaga]